METTMEDVKKVYFTDEIANYKHTLATSTISTDTTLYQSDFDALGPNATYSWPVSVIVEGVTITIGEDVILRDASRFFNFGGGRHDSE